jgi:hypothetical protein
LQLIADLNENNHGYVLGYILCSQLKKERRVLFYLDTCSSKTTLLDIDIVRLGFDWRNLNRATCSTAVGEACPFVLQDVTLRLEILNNGEKILYPFPLEFIHLLPPDDPTTIVPVQYVFAYSLLGMDVLKNFKTWKFEYQDKKLILET